MEYYDAYEGIIRAAHEWSILSMQNGLFQPKFQILYLAMSVSTHGLQPDIGAIRNSEVQCRLLETF
jgi:hypothetical protein